MTQNVMIEATLRQVESDRDLSMEDMCATICAVMEGRWDDDQIARLLLALHRKGQTVAEVAGAAAAMRRHVTPIRSVRAGVLDTCGTGGDRSGTFNISTAAALVAAAAGVPVAKHGNRGVTSRSGSADVAAALGVNIDADVACVQACLDELGVCFCFAPLFHSAMKRVAAVRKRLGVPTIFNILGPLVNPAGAAYQLIGVGQDSLRRLLAEALVLLGTERAAVVHGEDGLDEVTLGTTTLVTEVTGAEVRELRWTPEDFGLPRFPKEALLVDGPEQSAATIRDVLAGMPGPAREVVIANAAAALWVARKSASLEGCTALVREAIDSHRAADLLERLVQRTNPQPSGL